MNAEKTNYQSEILTGKEIRRYALQIGLPDLGMAGQEKIKQSKILVIGAGGKGTSALENLVSLGIGKIGICDNFPVQENELSRQHLYGTSDLGKQKAIIARQKLREINHSVDFQIHNVCLTKDNILGICEPYDALIDATDNFSAHYLINDSAIKLNKPLIFGSVFGFVGKVSVFNYKGGPSLRCAYSKPEVSENSGNSKEFSCQLTLISIIGAIIANEAIKVLLDKESMLNGNLLTIDTGNYAFSTKKITKNPENFS